MSIWAGIKHAINSTLGKEYFQPLDRIIVGGKQIVADENEINCYIPMSTSSFTGIATTPVLCAAFRTRYSGNFYIEVQGNGKQVHDAENTNDKYKPCLNVYVNGTVAYSGEDWKLFDKTMPNPTYTSSFDLPYSTLPNYVILNNVPANALVEVKYFCNSVHSTNTSYLNLTSLYLKGKIQEVFAEGV